MKLLTWCWWKAGAILRRLWLALTHVNEPWDERQIDMTRPELRRMLARAIRTNRRELRGARIVRKYSRDPVVERRERLIEQRAADESQQYRSAESADGFSQTEHRESGTTCNQGSVRGRDAP